MDDSDEAILAAYERAQMLGIPLKPIAAPKPQPVKEAWDKGYNHRCRITVKTNTGKFVHQVIVSENSDLLTRAAAYNAFRLMIVKYPSLNYYIFRNFEYRSSATNGRWCSGTGSYTQKPVIPGGPALPGVVR